MALLDKLGSDKTTSGFTLVELLVVMAISATLFSLVWINVMNPIKDTSIDSALQVLIADLKSQQNNAMVGMVNNGSPTSYGIYFEETGYTLFAGSYTEGAEGNYEVALEPGLSLSTTFSGNQVLFEHLSGEVVGHNPSADTITISYDELQSQDQLEINPLGAISF